MLGDMPCWLLKCILTMLIGEIDPDTDAVGVTYQSNVQVTVRFYRNRPPTEEEIEDMLAMETVLFGSIANEYGAIAIESIDVSQTERRADPEETILFSKKPTV